MLIAESPVIGTLKQEMDVFNRCKRRELRVRYNDPLPLVAALLVLVASYLALSYPPYLVIIVLLLLGLALFCIVSVTAGFRHAQCIKLRFQLSVIRI